MSSRLIPRRMQQIEAELNTLWAGHPTTVLETVDSTNRYLKKSFLKGTACHGAAVWADAQTDGRGRLGRTWISPSGTHIYTSILVQPPRERLSGVLSLVAGIGVVRAVRSLTGLDARMKWPNDGVIHGRKFSGVLVEAGIDPSPWAILGIGVNVLGLGDPMLSHATTIQSEWGQVLAREDLWTLLMSEVEVSYDAWIREGDEWAVETWARHNATLLQAVRVERPGEEPWVGIAERIDVDGGLWVAGADRREKVISGEVSLRLADGRYAPESF